MRLVSARIPVREGFTFLWWNTNSGATVASFQPGDTFTATVNTTLYAIWATTMCEPPAIVSSIYAATPGKWNLVKYETYGLVQKDRIVWEEFLLTTAEAVDILNEWEGANYIGIGDWEERWYYRYAVRNIKGLQKCNGIGASASQPVCFLLGNSSTTSWSWKRYVYTSGNYSETSGGGACVNGVPKQTDTIGSIDPHHHSLYNLSRINKDHRCSEYSCGKTECIFFFTDTLSCSWSTPPSDGRTLTCRYSEQSIPAGISQWVDQIYYSC